MTDTTGGLDPAPETIAELDRRAERLREAPEDFAAMDGLWRAVYGLDRWIFIARGSQDAPQPFMVEPGDGPLLLAYTTGERAVEGGMKQGLSREEASLLLAIPLPGAIEWAASFAQAGVRAIAFDLPRFGYFAPLGNLLPMRDHIASTPPAS